MIKQNLILLTIGFITATSFAQDMQSKTQNSQSASKAKYFPKNPLEVQTKTKKDYTKWRFGFNVGAGNFYNAEYLEHVIIGNEVYAHGDFKKFPVHLNLQLNGMYYFSKHFGVGLKYDQLIFGNQRDCSPYGMTLGIISPTISYRYITPNKKHTIYTNLSAGISYECQTKGGYFEWHDHSAIVNLEVGYDYHINKNFSIGGKVNHGVVINDGPFDCWGNHFGATVGVGYHF